MKLTDLCRDICAPADSMAETEVSGLTADSREVRPGMVFAALPGFKVDGARFVADAIAKGAVAVLAAEGAALVTPAGFPVLRASDPRRALALMAARLHARQPATIVAVTGTNGKTSVVSFVRQIWAGLGYAAASLGTVGLVTPKGERASSHTTPEPVALHRMLAEIAGEGVSHLAVEASSHGLEQRRLDGLVLAAGAFTNITRDHLDHHKDFEDYFHQKLRLFSQLLPKGAAAVINMDDAEAARVGWTARRGAQAAEDYGLRLLTVGRHGESLRLLSAERDGFAQRLVVLCDGQEHKIRLPLAGDFQTSNALVAAGLAIATGGEPGAVFQQLERLKGAKGRLEHVGTSAAGAPIFVDYAHTPDGLANALAAVRPYAARRLVAVFGCGGDRDKGKRPLMGKIAAEQADTVIVTDDNPRTEDATAIRREIMAGAAGAREIGDRQAAITQAVADLEVGDVLLVAGKGHEEGQIVGNAIIPFSDHTAVATALTVAARDRRPLWTLDEIMAAIGPCRVDGYRQLAISGVSIDTRTLAAGDLFVALKDVRDGHDFVTAAFAAGAAAALVEKGYQHPAALIGQTLIRVEDPLRTLEAIGVAARARTTARIIAVTGSVGKTGTKEMLRACLGACAGDARLVHASAKSYNNHWGVPLTLARMPAETHFAVFEIGMNHAGEITPLTRMVRPHVALITTVEPVHLGQFPSVEAIADAKAEVFAGLAPGGVAVLNRDNPHFERLQAAAEARHARAVSFGEHADASTRLLAVDLDPDGSVVQARMGERPFGFRIGVPGRHIVQNALGALTALVEAGACPLKGSAVLAGLRAPDGRGAREVLPAAGGGRVLLIDESYNASPASMAAALAVLATVPREMARRRIAVLGDMRELGEHADRLHAGLAEVVESSGVDLVFACGPHMKALCAALPKQLCAEWAPTSAELRDKLLQTVAAGDVVMIKGSLGSAMGPLVTALRSHFGPGR